MSQLSVLLRKYPHLGPIIFITGQLILFNIAEARMHFRWP